MLTTSVRPKLGRKRAILVLGVLLSTALARAEEPDSQRTQLGHERADAQLTVSGVKLDGSQTQPGFTLGYDGWSYNDLALLLRIFGTSPVGGFLDVKREAFSLLAGKDAVLSGNALSLSVGPTGRIHAGPVTLALTLGYQLQQLADFSPEAIPRWTPATRNSVFGDLRISAGFGIGGVEAFGRYPFALGVSAPGVSSPKSTGYLVGGAVLFNLVEATPILFRAGLRYAHEQDTLTGTGSFSSGLTQNEFGIVIDAAWLAPKPSAEVAPGSIGVSAHDASGTALASVRLTLVSPTGERTEGTTAPDGSASFSELESGHYSVEAALEDFGPGAGAADVRVGERSQVELTLTAIPKVGSLRVTVLEAETKRPAKAQVKVGADMQPTDADGNATFADLKAGNYAISVSAAGHKPGQEAAQVVAGRETDVEVKLLKLQEAAPAMLSGILRTVSGHPVAATLDIPEAKLHIRAGEDGRFSVRVPQGTYRVVISAPGYLTQAKTVTLKPGDQAIFNVDLHPTRP